MEITDKKTIEEHEITCKYKLPDGKEGAVSVVVGINYRTGEITISNRYSTNDAFQFKNGVLNSKEKWLAVLEAVKDAIKIGFDKLENNK